MAGMLGIGGGIILVPFVFVFDLMQVSEAVIPTWQLEPARNNHYHLLSSAKAHLKGALLINNSSNIRSFQHL